MYNVVYTEIAKKQLDCLHGKLKSQIERGLQRIAQNPKLGKPLKGELKGIWSERVSTFRILYKIYDKKVEILILLIEHRKSIYGDH